jgi:uncharacterized protein (TIGR02466 family)
MIANVLFAVPIWDIALPNFKEVKGKLITDLKDYLNDNPPEVRSNVNGKHSRTLLHEDPRFTQLFNFITNIVNESAESIGLPGNLKVMESWVNINDTPGAFNLQHIHGGVISGCLYIQVPKGSGKLYLTNPAPIHLWEGLNVTPDRNEYSGETKEVDPIEGTIIMFPSYLPHAVGPNTSDVERISVAFNTTAEKSNGIS